MLHPGGIMLQDFLHGKHTRIRLLILRCRTQNEGTKSVAQELFTGRFQKHLEQKHLDDGL